MTDAKGRWTTSRSRNVLIAFLAIAIALPAAAQAQACKRKECLTEAEQCSEAKVKVQTDSSKLSDLSTAALATVCFENAKSPPVTATAMSIGLSAYNSARLFDELARRSTLSEDRMAYLEKAGEAAALSREKLADTAIWSGDTKESTKLQNIGIRRERLGILLRSLFERGLARRSDGSCGGELACLTAGLKHFEPYILYPTVEGSNAEVRTAFSELQILRARASARRNDLSPDNGDFERAVEYLKAAVSNESSSTSATSQSIVSRALGLVLDLSSAEAERILSQANPTPDAVSRAVRLLEDADTMLAGATLAMQRPKLKLARGGALMRRAQLRTVSDAAAKAGDQCAAAMVFDEGVAAGPSAELKIDLLEAAGMARSGLAADQNAQCGGLNSAGLNDKALSAFDQAWQLRKASSKGANLDVVPRHIALLHLRGQKPDSEMLAALRIARGEQAMLVQLELARSAATVRPQTMEARLLAEDHFSLAIGAYAMSPLPELERGKFLYGIALSGLADADSMRARADLDFANAIREGDSNPTKYAAELAEAYYFRSKNQTLLSASKLADQASRNQAVEWASKAFYANSAKAEYSFQACRATLLARNKLLGNAVQFCSVSASSAEGALLRAFMLFRDSQIKRIASPSNTSSVFRQAEDAFGYASEVWNAEKSAGKTSTINWPAGGGELDPGQVADYGKWLARQCTLDASSSDPVPEGASATMKLFGRYGLFYCNRFDDPDSN